MPICQQFGTHSNFEPSMPDGQHATRAEGLQTLSRWISGASFHVGITVPDMYQALEFYVGLLGFTEAWRRLDVDMSIVSGVRGLHADIVQLLVQGGSRLELQRFVPAGSRSDRRQHDAGLSHLSFGVVDIAAEYARLEAAGVEFIGTPTSLDFGPGDALTGWTVVYFRDPFGVLLELFGPTSGFGNSVDDDERGGRLP